MVFTGLHGMIGILISNTTIRSDSNAAQVTRWATVVGSLFPDIDIFGSILIYLLTFNEEQTIGFHRTITHSYIVLGLVLIIGCFLLFIPWNHYKLASYFLLGYSFGAIIHSFFDLLYFDGVALLWPLSIDKGWNLVGITYKQFPDWLSKTLLTIDTFFEPFFWLLLSYLAAKHETDASITIGKFEINDFPNKLSRLSRIILLLIPIYLFMAFFIPLSLKDFVILLYIVGMFVLAFSMAFVVVMKQTLQVRIF